MRRGTLPLLAGFILVSALSLPFLGRSFSQTPPECARGFGHPVVGTGPRSQTVVHYRLFLNRYHSPAHRNAGGTLADYEGGCRDDVQGLVAFTGQNTSAVVTSLLFRHSDSLKRMYLFYGLDRPLSPVEKYRAESQVGAGRILAAPYPILQMPIWLDVLTVAYNLSCPTGNEANQLRMTSNALSQVFSGAATKWSDASIAATNPHLDGDPVAGIPPCDQTVRVAVRSDVTEQTAVFKDYLSKQNPQWRPLAESKVNTQWPATLLDPCRGRGDAGMATCVAGLPGSIGYVSLPEASRRGLRTAAIFNRSGSREPPSQQGCTSAGEFPAGGYGGPDPRYPQHASGDWSHVSLTDGPVGYPLCSIQYAMAFQIMKFSYLQAEGTVSVAQTETIRSYLKWTTLPATQARLEKFQLARLPEELRRISQEGASSIVYEP